MQQMPKVVHAAWSSSSRPSIFPVLIALWRVVRLRRLIQHKKPGPAVPRRWNSPMKAEMRRDVIADQFLRCPSGQARVGRRLCQRRPSGV